MNPQDLFKNWIPDTRTPMAQVTADIFAKIIPINHRINELKNKKTPNEFEIIAVEGVMFDKVQKDIQAVHDLAFAKGFQAAIDNRYQAISADTIGGPTRNTESK